MYVEHGGRFSDGGTFTVHKGSYAALVQPGRPIVRLMTLSGSAGMPGAAYASMACSPVGQLYIFGGLTMYGYTILPVPNSDNTMKLPEWKPHGSLFSAKLGGSSSVPAISRAVQLAPAAKGAAFPSARSGHVLTYLPSSTVSQLGLQSDVLLLYGGSDINTTLGELLANKTTAPQLLNASEWDTTAWLYDIAADKWRKLAPVGDLPPGLMYHSMAVEGKQVSFVQFRLLRRTARTGRCHLGD